MSIAIEKVRAKVKAMKGIVKASKAHLAVMKKNNYAENQIQAQAFYIKGLEVGLIAIENTLYDMETLKANDIA